MIYVASKTRHAQMWLDFRKDGFPISSTWIDEAEVGKTSDWSDLWVRCVKEAAQSAALVLYAEAGDLMKGALVEVGAALAMSRPVYAVGAPSNSSWFNHPLVTICSNIEEAMWLARRHVL